MPGVGHQQATDAAAAATTAADGAAYPSAAEPDANDQWRDRQRSWWSHADPGENEEYVVGSTLNCRAWSIKKKQL